MEIRRHQQVHETRRREYPQWKPQEERQHSHQTPTGSDANSSFVSDSRQQIHSQGRFADLLRGYSETQATRPPEVSNQPAANVPTSQPTEATAPRGPSDADRNRDIRFSDELRSTQQIVDSDAYIVRDDDARVGSNQEIRWENHAQYNGSQEFDRTGQNDAVRFAENAPVSTTEASGQPAAYSLARVLAMNGTPSLSLYV